MEDFYLTLPSSTESKLSQNTLSVFTTRLPQVLNLEKDKWVVAATDIIYPYSFKNVSKILKYYIHFKDARQPLCLNLPANQYNTVEQVLSVLNGISRRKRNLQQAINEDIGRQLGAQMGKRTGSNGLGNIGNFENAGNSGSSTEISGNAEGKDENGENVINNQETSTNVDNITSDENERNNGGNTESSENNSENAENSQSTGNNVGNAENVEIVKNTGGNVEVFAQNMNDEAKLLAFLLTFILVTLYEEKVENEIEDHLNAETEQTTQTGLDLNSNSHSIAIQESLSKLFEAHFEKLEKLSDSESDSLQKALEKALNKQSTFLETFNQVNNPNILNGVVDKLTDHQTSFLKSLAEKETNTSLVESIQNAMRNQLAQQNSVKNDYEKLLEDVDDTRVNELSQLREAMKPRSVHSAKDFVHFELDNDLLKINFTNPDILFVEFDKDCAYFLGFDNLIVHNSSSASSSIDFFGNISTLYVYCDIVDQTIVGDSKSSLLTVIPCKGKYGEMVQHTFPVPRYLPIMNATIDSIRVQILSEFGERIKFNWGSTIITLHFRKIC